MMPVHAFVDESKQRGYVFVAALLDSCGVSVARKGMARLSLPGQPRVHFVRERDSRRRQILDTIVALGVQATVYDASTYSSPKKQRTLCLSQLVADLAVRDARMLVLERDDSVVEFDKQLLYQQVRLAGCERSLSYRHERARVDPLLAIPDAIAWCWSRGGDWKKRASPLVSEVRQL